MSKIVMLDNSIDTYIRRAENAYIADDILTACNYIERIRKVSPLNFEANMLLAQIYSELSQIDASNQIYFDLIAVGYKDEVFESIITNLLQMDELKLAKYYNEKYKVRYDFSQIIANIDDFEDIDENFEPRKFKLIVSKKSKSGENLVNVSKKQNISNVENVKVTDKDYTDFLNQLKLFNNDYYTNTYDSIKIKSSFKLAYPLTKVKCEEVLEKGFQLFTEGKHSESIDILNRINEQNGSYYYQAEKIKSMNYLALNQLNKMLESVEVALKGLPNDFSIKCYYFMVTHLLGDAKESKKMFNNIMKTNPINIVEQMNKLDVCRLAENHEGVLSECRKILEELPFHPIFLLLYAKAQFNIGAKDSAVISLKNIKKIYSYLWEIDILLNDIKNGAKMLSYSDVEVDIARAKAEQAVFSAIQSHSFGNYLKDTKNAKSVLHFVLSGDNISTVSTIIKDISKVYSADIKDVFNMVLMDNRINNETKKQVLKVMMSDNCIKPSVKILIGNLYKEFKIQPIINYDNVSKNIKQAYFEVMMDIIFNDYNYEKSILKLSVYTNMLAKKISLIKIDDSLLNGLNELKNTKLLKMVLSKNALGNYNRADIKREVLSKDLIAFSKYAEIISKIEALDENN